MHTGINTGLVVTEKLDREKGIHGLTGDTVNVASRLEGISNTGEILVGPDTYRQAEGHFHFEKLKPTKVQGKSEPIRVYKVISAKERPDTIHRLSGLRAELISRKAEMTELRDAVESLREGKGRILSIFGDAGTGKSRLVEEFKSTLDLDMIQWIEGHAYAYAQNITYFPVIDLLSRTFAIEESDPPEKVREKIETEVGRLAGDDAEIISYVGSLYSLSYPEVDEVSPEFWKSRLKESIQVILSSLVQRSPTVIFLEDLHWPSGTALVAKGNMREGFEMIEKAHQSFIREERKYYTALSEYILGKIYSQIAEGASSISPLNIARNIGFLVKTLPFACRKADFHFRKSIEIVKDIGANSLLARTYLDCGLLCKAKKRNEKAREYISKAIEIFEQYEAEIYLKQAKEELSALQ